MSASQTETTDGYAPDTHARVTMHTAERVKPMAGVQLIPADKPCRITRER